MDLNGQLKFTDSPLNERFEEGLSYIQKGDFKRTLEIMEEIFNINPHFIQAVDAIKAVKFWQSRWTKVFQVKEGFERAHYLLNEWDAFQNFMDTNKIGPGLLVIHVKNLIFKKIIRNLILTYQQSEVPNIEILVQIGEIFLSIDEIQKSIETFEYARLFRKRDSYLLSLLAEAYYRSNNIKLSKLLFREAFLYNPEKIDLSKLTADFLHTIIEHIQHNFSMPGPVLVQWIPVYGVLLNHLNCKRELASDEMAKLKEEAEALEKQYHSKHFSDDDTVPRLINRYFWLLDYYVLQNSNEEYIKIYLDKLREVDPKIHREYQHLLKNNAKAEVQ